MANAPASEVSVGLYGNAPAVSFIHYRSLEMSLTSLVPVETQELLRALLWLPFLPIYLSSTGHEAWVCGIRKEV